MASVCNDPRGRRRILFVAPDGSRKAVRLGKVSQRQAEAVCIRIEDLSSSMITGHAPSDETSRWVTGLDEKLHAKLAAVKLVKPREEVGLKAFLDNYIGGRCDVKPRTTENLERVEGYLLEVFPADKALRDITAGDAEDFRSHMIKSGRASNTIRRAIGRCRQFFKAAIRRGLIQQNPFEGIAAAVQANPERFHFISQQHAEKIIEQCPDAQWRLIVALSRYGGLRCPSEVLALTWGDINWADNRIRVPSPKTAHHAGGASRIIPLFPELLPHLREAFELAEPGTEYVITRYRDGGVNLRTQFHRIIRQAGLEPWEKPFQNMRSTRETELADTFPMHAVCAWIGNSQPVAAKHYLQITDEHFRRAIETPTQNAAQNRAQKPLDMAGNDSKAIPPEGDVTLCDFEGLRRISSDFESLQEAENSRRATLAEPLSA